jgi:hypothetical protein
MSTLFFPFLRVTSLQNDSYKLISSNGTVDYLPLLEPDGDSPPTKLWSDDSYWYMKIIQNPKLHPDSDKIANWIKNICLNKGGRTAYPTINWAGWTGVIYDCYEDTPVYHILDTDSNKYYDVPFPDPYPIAIPSDADGSVIIVDRYRGYVWDFWAVEATGGTYHVGDSMRLDLYGDGLWHTGLGWGSGGSGITNIVYMIRPEEIEAGVINHVLGCTFGTVGPYEDGSRYSMVKGFVNPPAAHTDRKVASTNPYEVPEGARIQLDPAIDLDSLGLSTTGKIIAKAMQDYGIVAAEAGGVWVIYAEHDLTADWNPPQMNGGLLKAIGDLVTSSYNPWRIIDFDLYPTVDDLSEYE